MRGGPAASPAQLSEPTASRASGAAVAAPSPAAGSSLAAIAALDARLAPLEGPRQDELKRKRDDLERELAALELEQRQLARQIAPLQSELDRVGGYLELVNERPSPVPAWLPADAPPSALLAAGGNPTPRLKRDPTHTIQQPAVATN